MWGGTGYDHQVLPFHIKNVLFISDFSFSTGNLRLLLDIVESESFERSVCLNETIRTETEKESFTTLPFDFWNNCSLRVVALNFCRTLSFHSPLSFFDKSRSKASWTSWALREWTIARLFSLKMFSKGWERVFTHSSWGSQCHRKLESMQCRGHSL